MKRSQNKRIIKCGFLDCNHSCIRDDDVYPPDGTPMDRVAIKNGDRSRSMFCSGCNRYTIYVRSEEEYDYFKKKYNIG
ncbi:MAG: hypothetical protein ABIH39_00115 [Candidatus Margulisiibacteriota bacterium]